MRSRNVGELSKATLALACIAGITVCASVEVWGQSSSVKELAPGLLEGYLAAEDLPNSLALLPPPPKEGSAAFARDEEAARAVFKLRGSPRWDQAIKDADLEFPAAADVFSDAMGFKVTEKHTPHLYLLLRRTLTDAGLSTYRAKNKYQRKRPFMLNKQPIGTPDDEEGLRKDGSYPSGHTAIGWAWALILCENETALDALAEIAQCGKDNYEKAAREVLSASAEKGSDHARKLLEGLKDGGQAASEKKTPK